jgi:hypothetical protein
VSAPFNDDQLRLPRSGDNYTVPVGVLGQLSINKQLAIGHVVRVRQDHGRERIADRDRLWVMAPLSHLQVTYNKM